MAERRPRIRARIAPIERVVEYTNTHALLEKLRDRELDVRFPVRRLRRRLLVLEEELCGLLQPDTVRTFLVGDGRVLVIFSHCYGGHDWRGVKFTTLERLEL